jgi:hypothetical protein
VKIRVADPERLGELLSHLRKRRCIAYVVGEQTDTIEAVLPHLFGSREQEAVRELVTEWQAETGAVEVELLPE